MGACLRGADFLVRGAHTPREGFSASALARFGARLFFLVGEGHPANCGGLSSIPGLHHPDASSMPPSRDNQKRLLGTPGLVKTPWLRGFTDRPQEALRSVTT